MACLVALILGMPTFINGAPLFYEDSTSYVARGIGPVRAVGADFHAGRVWLHDELRQALPSTTPVESKASDSQKPAKDRIWTASRSVSYSIVTYLFFAFTGFAGVVIMQALLVALPITLLWKRCLDLSDRWLFVASAILAVATSLGFFVGLIMPDFMAAVVILIPATLLALRSRLFVLDIVTLWAILVYATMVHDSHLAILAMLVVGAWALYFAGLCRKIGEKGIATPIILSLALCAGVVAMQGYAALAVRVTGQPLLRLPHLTAHLSALPLGVDFLNQNCPRVGFEMCLYRDKLPLAWTDFMFGDSLWGNLSYPEQRRISEEQVPLLVAIFKSQPAATTIAFGKDALEQLFMISYFDLDQAKKIPFFAERMPPSVTEQIASSLLVRHPKLLDIESFVQQLLVLIALPVLVIIGMRLFSTANDPFYGRWFLFVAVVPLGVVANGIICGVLAFPYDRFQARVIWLIPFLAITSLALFGQASNAKRA
jgi:hypothetical protein